MAERQNLLTVTRYNVTSRAISFRCPRCNASYKAEHGDIGEQFACETCASAMLIPGAAELEEIRERAEQQRKKKEERAARTFLARDAAAQQRAKREREEDVARMSKGKDQPLQSVVETLDRWQKGLNEAGCATMKMGCALMIIGLILLSGCWIWLIPVFS